MSGIFQALFIYVDVDVDDHVRILEFFNTKVADCPTYRYINLKEDGMAKFKPDSNEITVEEVRQFVQEILDGKRQVSSVLPEGLHVSCICIDIVHLYVYCTHKTYEDYYLFS